MKRKLIVLFVFAFLIRLVGLNQSLWLDEAVTAKVAHMNILAMLSSFSPGDFHPPLYYMFMIVWTKIFGYTEIFLRLPSVLCSLMTGYILYLIGKKYYSTITGFWFAALYLLNPLGIYYSQEARMYSMVTCMVTGVVYTLFSIVHPLPVVNSKVKLQKSKLKVKSQNLAGLIFLILLSVSSLFIFYGSIFVIAAMILILVWQKKYREGFVLGVSICIGLLLLSPLLTKQLINAKNAMQIVPHWSLVLGKASVKNLLLIPLKFSVGRISFYPKALYWIISGTWTAFMILFIVKGFKKSYVIVTMMIVPLLIAFIFSFFTPLLSYFRFLYLLPLFCMMIVLGIASLSSKKTIRPIVLGGFMIFSLLYVLFPRFHREDWKSLSKEIPANKTVYMIEPSSDPIRYYKPMLTVREIRNISSQRFIEQEIYVIPYVTQLYGFDYQNALTKRGCNLNEKRTFRELVLEKWRCQTLAKK